MQVPFSALLSKIFLQYTESKQVMNLINNYTFGYFRHVDNVIVVYDLTLTNINTKPSEFKQGHPELQSAL